MIDAKKLIENDIGREVICTFPIGTNRGRKCFGKIVNWENFYIYVKYENFSDDWGWYENTVMENNGIGIRTYSNYLDFKPIEIATRAELFIFDED